MVNDVCFTLISKLKLYFVLNYKLHPFAQWRGFREIRNFFYLRIPQLHLDLKNNLPCIDRRSNSFPKIWSWVVGRLPTTTNNIDVGRLPTTTNNIDVGRLPITTSCLVVGPLMGINKNNNIDGGWQPITTTI